MHIKEALRGELTEKEISLVKNSFDVVGSVAILEIPEGLAKKEKVIAKKLMELHKNIHTVCKKAGYRSGTYRLRKYKRIIGNGFEIIHKESGCSFMLDIRKAYFSVRESTERLKISEKIKPKEKILVLFSGVGPFGIVLAKKHPDCNVDMVEINPAACKYAEENIRINKVSDRVKSYCGNIKKIGKELGKYNRIIMPLPETAYQFLDLAVKHCKKGGFIHLYSIEGNDGSEAENEIKKFKALKIVEKRQVLPYAPGAWKVCYELEKTE
jgi:tRNA (guanine37-N1)-methyltransferase